MWWRLMGFLGDACVRRHTYHCMYLYPSISLPGHETHALAVAAAGADLLAVLVVQVDDEPARRGPEAGEAGLVAGVGVVDVGWKKETRHAYMHRTHLVAGLGRVPLQQRAGLLVAVRLGGELPAHHGDLRPAHHALLQRLDGHIGGSGAYVGNVVGCIVGRPVGAVVGCVVGRCVGALVGGSVEGVGLCVGCVVGSCVGCCVGGPVVGCAVGGWVVGSLVGIFVGLSVGTCRCVCVCVCVCVRASHV